MMHDITIIKIMYHYMCHHYITIIKTEFRKLIGTQVSILQHAVSSNKWWSTVAGRVPEWPWHGRCQDQILVQAHRCWLVDAWKTLWKIYVTRKNEPIYGKKHKSIEQGSIYVHPHFQWTNLWENAPQLTCSSHRQPGIARSQTGPHLPRRLLVPRAPVS